MFPKKSSNEVLRPSGPEKKGWQLRGIRGMTFSIPQEEQGCNYSNQNIVWNKEPGNLPVSLHTSMININKDHQEGEASQRQAVFSTSDGKQRQSQHA